MPVAVMQPQRKQEDDPLTKIVKALSIANSIYGIKADISKAETAAAEKKALSDEKVVKKQELARTNAGILTPGQKLEQQKDYVFMPPEQKDTFLKGLKPDEKAPDFEEVKVANNGDESLFYRMVRPKEESPFEKLLKQQQLQKGSLDIQKTQKELAKPAKNLETFGTRFKNINNELDKLKELVQDKGTAEAFGPHEGMLAQKVQSIAIDTAKAFDPDSVAREGEVEMMKKGLFEPGRAFMRDSTALQLIDSFKQQIRDRAINEGYLDKDGKPLVPDNSSGKKSAPPPKPPGLGKNPPPGLSFEQFQQWKRENQ